MSLQLISATLDDYVIDQYPDKNMINLADATFTEPTGDYREWIQCRFNPIKRKVIGLNGTTRGRVEEVGEYKVTCFSTYRKTALKLADDITEMLDCKELDNNIRLELGIPHPPEDLDGKIWACSLSFLVKRS